MLVRIENGLAGSRSGGGKIIEYAAVILWERGGVTWNQGGDVAMEEIILLPKIFKRENQQSIMFD